MNSLQESDLYRENRIALLRYYNSQCMTHGGYVISIVVGLSVLISRFDVFMDGDLRYVFFAIMAVLFLLLIYLGSGTLYWGYLATAVIFLPIAKLSETKEKLSKEKKIEPTDMRVLHEASFEQVEKKHSTIVKVKTIPSRLIMWFSVKKICPYCETENKRNSIFCVKCGKKISEDRQM